MAFGFALLVEAGLFLYGDVTCVGRSAFFRGLAQYSVVGFVLYSRLVGTTVGWFFGCEVCHLNRCSFSPVVVYWGVASFVGTIVVFVQRIGDTCQLVGILWDGYPEVFYFGAGVGVVCYLKGIYV